MRLLVDWSKGKAAAFGRLCVETCGNEYVGQKLNAAAFGRLCVETKVYAPQLMISVAAAFGRLCVETVLTLDWRIVEPRSRLRAAVC